MAVLKPAKHFSNLYALTYIEWREETEEKMEAAYKSHILKVKNLAEKERHDAFIGLVSQGLCNDIALGLLYGILTNAETASENFRDLTFITGDAIQFALTKVNWIIIEMFPKLLDFPRNQLLWFIKESIKSGIKFIENVCVNLLRHCTGGGLSVKNFSLVDYLLTVFMENRTWLDQNASLIPHAVLTFLRLIPDHFAPAYELLRQREVNFCITMLREKFMECAVIGRDLIRLLINVTRIPEFDLLWKDLLENPTVLSSQFKGIGQLMNTRTSKRFVVSLITFDMERKVFYLLQNVRTQCQKYCLDWLQREFFSMNESQFTRADWIRYVCSCIHPTNEVLSSEVVPRWSFIVWLLSTCSNKVEAQCCKLALFFDWLFYDAEKDSIMNIEPGILAISFSIRMQPNLTVTLLDFLCRIVTEFYPPLRDKFRAGVAASFRQILDKKVILSFVHILEFSRFDEELRIKVHDLLRDFCPKEGEEPSVESPVPVIVIDDSPEPETIDLSIDEGDTSQSSRGTHHDVAEVERILETTKLTNSHEEYPTLLVDNKRELINPLVDPAPSDISKFAQQLDENLKFLVQDLYKGAEGNEVPADRMHALLLTIFREKFSKEQFTLLAECLCGLFNPFFARKVFPIEKTKGTGVDEAFSLPFFMIFRNLCMTPEDDPSRRPILLLLAEIYEKQQRIGYMLLYFLKNSTCGDKNMSAYRNLCKTLDNELDTMLISDLKLCHSDDELLFFHLVPEMYRKFPNVAFQSADLMRLLVSSVDGSQVRQLICEIVQGNLQLFRKDTFMSILNASLQWEAIPQYFFWQLITADDVPLEWVFPLIPKLEYDAHAEAMSNIILILRRLDKEPTTGLVRLLLNRDPFDKSDLFAVTALKVLIDDYEDKVADLIANQLTRSCAIDSVPQKNKKSVPKMPTLEEVLGHLDMLLCHNVSENLFSKESIQNALKEVRETCSDSVKTKFSEFFTSVDALHSVRDSRTLRRGRKPHASPNLIGEFSDDEVKAPKSAKKRKKIVEFDSD